MVQRPLLATAQAMTADEARACVNAIRRNMDEARRLLLDLYEREGWRALGYASWRECVQAEFGQSQAYLYRQLQAAEIERAISPMGEIGQIPERQLRPLAALETTEERREAWQEAVETAPDGKLTAAHVEAVVERRRDPERRLRDRERWERQAEEREPKLAPVLAMEHSLFRCGDFRDLARELPDESVDLIFTDPPYPKEFLPLWSDLAEVAARVLKPNGMLVAYSGQAYLDEVMGRLSSHLAYWWLGAVVHGGSSQVLVKDYPVRKVRNRCKPLLFYVRPDFSQQAYVLDDLVMGAGSEKDTHDWQQGVSEAEWYIAMLTPSDGTVFDPFLGGGTTALAACRLGRRAIGFELDAATYAAALERLERELRHEASQGLAI